MSQNTHELVLKALESGEWRVDHINGDNLYEVLKPKTGYKLGSKFTTRILAEQALFDHLDHPGNKKPGPGRKPKSEATTETKAVEEVNVDS